MNRRTVGILLFGLFAFLLALCVSPADLRSRAAAESRGECVVEISSRRFLHERNADLPLPMASTTKILTAITVIDDCDLGEKVVIPKEAEGVEGSSVYLRAGEEYTVEELLYGLMLRSGNDCAAALALHHSGSIEKFARRMNEKAALLGARDSFFVNPHGLPAEGHHTTARDLALIAAYAMEDPTFRKIVSTKYFDGRNWQNKNKMLFRYEGADGVKTGYTVKAGRCLVTSAEREGMRLVCVVLNSPEMYERTEELLDGAFGRYSMATLLDSSQPVGGLRAAADFRYPLTEEERAKVTLTVEPCDPLPAARGEFAGVVKIRLENSLLFCTNLYIM